MSENITAQGGEKTFTQDQLNKIVQTRLAEDRAKNESALAQREQELARRELKLNAMEELSKAGLATEWADVLDLSSAESLGKALELVKGTKISSKGGFMASHINAPSDDEGNAIRGAMGLQKEG